MTAEQKRNELRILTELMSLVGNSPIPARLCNQAKEVLDYLQSKMDPLERALGVVHNGDAVPPVPPEEPQPPVPAETH